MAAHQLYLIRHGRAEERGDRWPDDSKRPLTDDGSERVLKAARGLERLGTTLDVVLTSPFVRTHQTAELTASAFDSRPPIVTLDSLTPNGSFQAFLEDLEKQARRSKVAIVGHEPDLGEMAARLCGLRQPLPFRKGAVCRIDVNTIPPSSAGTIRWFMTATMLGALRKR
ncbi:MAG: phosphohistidine phosphatase SixA [Vicinamibacterales bacterium]